MYVKANTNADVTKHRTTCTAHTALLVDTNGW